MLQSGGSGSAADQSKQDLIAELKMSKDITGIKKLKVERAKTEERQEKEIISEISKQLTATQFVEKVPELDATGNPIPPWKRQMLARKAAERARKEMEEKMQRDAEMKRLSAIPAWKRQLLAKKEETAEKVGLYTPRVVDDKPGKPQQQTQHANGQEHQEECDKENSDPQPHPGGEGVCQGVCQGACQGEKPLADTNGSSSSSSSTNGGTREEDDAPAQIIPWRAQLRKTNSTLSLLE